MTLSLICPHDRHPLAESESGLSCAKCGRQYPIQDGVVCTLDHPDDFYEGAYENQTRFPFFYPYTALMRLIDTLFCPWLPVDWARIDLAVCKKER